MIKVNSSQFNYQYGDQIHFPYSIGSLISYLNSNYEIHNDCKFERTFVFRDKINEYITLCKDTNILLCSCYVWNWEITAYLAREVKKLNPNCTVIFGGPQVPLVTNDFFKEFPYVDILVHGEGELILKNILTAYMNDKDYSQIRGITTKEFTNPPEARIDDLDIIPSPYLTNTIWNLVEKINGVKWIASWETNRGCPYLCTFCDWGSATATKMRNWAEDRLFKEIEWFADNKIPYIDCCDANFGIYQDRDKRIATKLKEETLKKGYPQTFRQSWAKNSSEKIIPIAKELQQAGLLTGVGIALETLDEETLKIIKRKNIDFDTLSELTDSFDSVNLPTYTEIIRGLPGESLQSFKDGLEILVSDTKIDSIYIYNCSVLPNAPLNEYGYRKKYEIEMIRSPIFLAHSSIHRRGIDEYEYIVTSSNSFTLEDLKEMFLFSWLIITFHNLGIFEYISKYYHQEKKLSFLGFYEIFLNFCRNKKSIFSDEYNLVNKYIDDGYSGKGWDYYDSDLGEIYWPIEEATWLHLMSNTKKLTSSIRSFMNYLENNFGYATDSNILDDLSKFQVFLLSTKDIKYITKTQTFFFDWKNYFVNEKKLKQDKKVYTYSNMVVERNDFDWNKKTIWYGRRSQKFKFNPKNLLEENPMVN